MELEYCGKIQAQFEKKKPEPMTWIKEKAYLPNKFFQRKISNNGPLVGDA
jgi:hypothetical protein